MPGLVHGIVSINPPLIQCDGCGRIDTGRTLNVAILTSTILFAHHFDPADGRRMCANCWLGVCGCTRCRDLYSSRRRTTR